MFPLDFELPFFCEDIVSHGQSDPSREGQVLGTLTPPLQLLYPKPTHVPTVLGICSSVIEDSPDMHVLGLQKQQGLVEHTAIPVLGKLRQEDFKFKASLGHLVKKKRWSGSPSGPWSIYLESAVVMASLLGLLMQKILTLLLRFIFSFCV